MNSNLIYVITKIFSYIALSDVITYSLLMQSEYKNIYWPKG